MNECVAHDTLPPGRKMGSFSEHLICQCQRGLVMLVPVSDSHIVVFRSNSDMSS